MSIAGNVDLLAARVAQEFNAVRSEIGSGGGGPTGFLDLTSITSVTDMNAAIAAAPEGTWIWWGAVEKEVDDTLVIPGGRALIGLGGRQELSVIRASAAFPAGRPLIASAGYMNNGTVADGRIKVVGMHLDLNNKVDSHGLVVYNFWSHFEDIQVANANGPNAHAFHVTDRSINGTNTSTNSHSENTFVRLRVMTATNGAHGFWAESWNNLSNMDGHLTDSFFSAVNGRAIYIERAAGWTVENNHTYGTGQDAIRLNDCYATKVIGNYIEDFGQADGSGLNYHGIHLVSVLRGRASIVMGNTVSTQQPDSPLANRFACYQIAAGAGQDNAYVVMTSNSAIFATSTVPTVKKSVGYRFGNTADVAPAQLIVEYDNNQLDLRDWWSATTQVAGTRVQFVQGITTAHAGDPGGYPSLDANARVLVENMPLALSGTLATAGATGTVTLDPTLNGNNRDLTMTGDCTLAEPAAGVNGQVLQVTAVASGADRTVTFDAALERLTGINASYTVPSGKKLRAALRYSSVGTGGWVVEAVGVTQ